MDLGQGACDSGTWLALCKMKLTAGALGGLSEIEWGYRGQVCVYVRVKCLVCKEQNT